MWSFLLPFKLAAKPLQRASLVLEMTRNQSLARFIVSIVPEAVEDRCVHRSLVAFNAGVLIEYISRLPEANEETVAFVLPALTSPLKKGSGAGKDCIVSRPLFVRGTCANLG
jgi:U3 small nucleolar RNA-associated protein 10